MSKRYGTGEFERADVEVRNSTWEMRHEFLALVAECRSEIFIDLVVPTNIKREFLLGLTIPERGALLFSAVAMAYGKPLHGLKVRPETLDTPFASFIKYLN